MTKPVKQIPAPMCIETSQDKSSHNNCGSDVSGDVICGMSGDESGNSVDSHRAINSMDIENEQISDEQAQLDSLFMQRAFELAQQAEQYNEIPVGAVVVYQGEIIGEGFNQSIMNNDPSSHAEMNAIRQAGEYLKNYRLINCTLYVTLEPCPMCAGLLVHSRINRLVYAASDFKTGAAGSAFNLVNNEQLNHQIQVRSHVMQAQCSQHLSAFFKRRRKEKKLAKK